MSIRGAGGTEGGVGRFFIGLVMIIVGGYLFLNAVRVTHHFSMGYALFRFGGFGVTSGMTLVPFIFGVCLIFYNYRNFIGWFLAGGSLVIFFFGIITSIHFSFQRMSAFDLLLIIVLLVGGIGLFLSSLRDLSDG